MYDGQESASISGLRTALCKRLNGKLIDSCNRIWPSLRWKVNNPCDRETAPVVGDPHVPTGRAFLACSALQPAPKKVRAWSQFSCLLFAGTCNMAFFCHTAY